MISKKHVFCRQSILFATLFVIAAVYCIHLFPGTPNPNEYSRLYQIRAVVQTGHLYIDSMIDKYGHLMDKAWYAGHYYCDKSFGISLLTIPFYALYYFFFGECSSNEWLKYFLSMLCVAMPHLISIIMLYFVFIRTHARRSTLMLTLVGYVFGTIAYTYGTLLYSHVTGAALITITYLLIEHWKNRYRLWQSVLIGLLLGLTVIMEYPLAIMVGWLGVLFIVRLVQCKRLWLIVPSILAGALPVAIQMYVHYASFGDPFATGYGYKSSRTQQSYHETGVFGVYLPTFESVYGVLISPSRGLFYFSPFLLFGFYAIYRMIRTASTRLQGIICAGSVVSFTLFAVSVVDWHAGWTVGPRYYLPVIPFLIIPLLQTGVVDNRLIRRVIYPALILWSVIHCVVITSAFHLIPEIFGVPLWDFSIPLLSRGYGVFSLPEALGIPGSVSRIILYGIVLTLFVWAFAVRFAILRSKRMIASLMIVVVLGVSAVMVTRLIARPDTVEKHFEMASIYGYWDKPVDRLEELYSIYRKQPNRVDYRYLLAQQLKELGFVSESIIHLEAIIDKVPTHQQALKDIVTLQSLLKSSENEYTRLKTVPTSSIIDDRKHLFHAVRIFIKFGDYDTAQVILNRAMLQNGHIRSLRQIQRCIEYITAR